MNQHFDRVFYVSIGAVVLAGILLFVGGFGWFPASIILMAVAMGSVSACYYLADKHSLVERDRALAAERARNQESLVQPVRGIIEGQ